MLQWAYDTEMESWKAETDGGREIWVHGGHIEASGGRLPIEYSPLHKSDDAAKKEAEKIANYDTQRLAAARARKAELTGVAQSKGYKPGWIYYRLKDEFGGFADLA